MYIMKKINRYLLKRQLEDTLKKETLSKNILLSLIHDGTLVLDKYSIYELIKIEPPIIKTVPISEVTPKNKIYLTTDIDVNEYIDKLKENLLNEIDNGKQVKL